MKILQMPSQQNCKHLVMVHRAKQHSFYDTDDQKSPTTAGPLVLGKPSLAHTCPKHSHWRKRLQEVAVEMKGCIAQSIMYSYILYPQILYCFISQYYSSIQRPQ